MEQGLSFHTPVVVIGTPRSGTSMTAGIFSQHGLWSGTCRQGDALNGKGYFENLGIKRLLKENFGHLVIKGIIAAPKSGWRAKVAAELKAQGYVSGVWVVKHSAMYWPVWHEFDAKYICCFRDPESIIRSGKKSGYYKSNDEAQIRASIKAHHDEMNALVARRKGVRVNTGDVANGDYETIIRALESVGVEPEIRKIERFVDRGLWHYAP